MRIGLFFFFLIFLLGCSQKPQPIADARLNDYALYDEKGNFHRFSYYNDSKGIVLFVQGNGCPIVRAAREDFQEIVDEFSKKGFTFFMINSNIQDTRESIQKETEAYPFPVPVLVDNAQVVANMLDITITAEVFILHPTTREILYRGPINNKFDYETQKSKSGEEYVKEALSQILNNKPPISKKQQTRGCKVTRWQEIEKQPITYTGEIGTIVTEHCAICHHEGGIGPWSMNDYNTLLGWSAMMKQVLLTQRMPPWKADPKVGHFKKSFALSNEDRRKIITWIDEGMPYGEGVDPLSLLEFTDHEWKGGAPDKIITLQKEEIPANGTIPYRYQTIRVSLEEDTWIKGIEIKPSNPKVMHHILITNKESNKQSPIISRPPRKWIDNFIALGAMGSQYIGYPDGSGVFFPKNAELIVQIHYAPTGKPEEDETQIGLYFSDQVPEKEFLSLAPANTTFEIPPFGKEVKIVAEDSIEKDILLHYVVPHMHYRGKSIKFKVQFPNGETKTVVSVADYNFNWQQLYQLEEALPIPKSSKIIVEGIFDNTYQNPFNPDPNKTVHFGLQSTDEMLIGFFNYTLQ
ncbi:MAG: redoxin domain-containing protein [Flavobacteriaceae bacterium]